jgi:pimeloyl-ACP methyl ester carboxylesterase
MKLCLALLAALATPSAARDRVGYSERLDADGASLFLEIRGVERCAPLLLWLHGGPGGAERPLFRYFNGALEERFVVACLDQRGAGRSFDPGADPARLTIPRHLADLHAVVEHLRRSLVHDRVLLIGHSWGGALALLYARDHPDRVGAVIAVAPLVSTRAQQQSEWEFITTEAVRRGDDDVQDQVRELGAPPYETSTEVLVAERLATRYGAVFHQEPSRIWLLLRGVLGGLVVPWEIPRFIRGNEVSLAAMHDELLGLDLAESVPALDVPVCFLLGRYDRHGRRARRRRLPRASPRTTQGPGLVRALCAQRAFRGARAVRRGRGRLPGFGRGSGHLPLRSRADGRDGLLDLRWASSGQRCGWRPQARAFVVHDRGTTTTREMA